VSQCRSCGAEIRWITTSKNKKNTPCAFEKTVRHGSEPPPAGKYYDEQGDMYDAKDVPCGLVVFRSHWGDCPGAKEFHK
jgi:hypothetical protein